MDARVWCERADEDTGTLADIVRTVRAPATAKAPATGPSFTDRNGRPAGCPWCW